MQKQISKVFKNGYNFQKVDVRGKLFFEYVPLEDSWLPLIGKNFMLINYFWGSGQFKGKERGGKLLEQCLAGSKKWMELLMFRGIRKNLL